MSKPSAEQCVQVVVRCRPMNSKERAEGRQPIVDVDLGNNQINLKAENGDGDDKSFAFDTVYDENCLQKSFYEESCYSLVESSMEGFNATIFAYGQTGCGKTHTMQGLTSPPELRGVIPRSFDHIFDAIRIAPKGTNFLVRCAYLEIYNEAIRDLLASGKENLDLREDPGKGVYVKDLTNIVVEDEAGINKVMDDGLKNRTVAATAMNDTSSRSHAIFTIWVEVNEIEDPATKKETFRVGKLNLVDLAGSERQKKTGASGDRLKEGSKINLSLSALGNVISALVDSKGKHIPYRDSKLTRLLQDSLGGNTKTLMVAAVSPADYNYDETLSTLRYAARAKKIKNKPKVNEDPKDAMLRGYKEEIEQLKMLLSQQGLVPPPSVPSSDAGVGSARTQYVDREKVVHVDREKVVHVEVEKVVVQKEYVPNERVVQDALNYNQSIVEQRDRLGMQLEKQAAERDALEKRIKALSKFMLGASGNLDEAGGIDAEELAKIQKAKERHEKMRQRAKKKKEKELEAEKQKMLLEKKEKEEELEGALEEIERVERMHNRAKDKLKKKLKDARYEIEDLNDEFDRERGAMFETIREQNKELKLWEQVVHAFLDRKQIVKILEKSIWNPDEQEWQLPKIKLRKEVLYGGGGAASLSESRQALSQTLPSIASGGGSLAGPRSPRSDTATLARAVSRGGSRSDNVRSTSSSAAAWQQQQHLSLAAEGVAGGYEGLGEFSERMGGATLGLDLCVTGSGVGILDANLSGAVPIGAAGKKRKEKKGKKAKSVKGGKKERVVGADDEVGGSLPSSKQQGGVRPTVADLGEADRRNNGDPEDEVYSPDEDFNEEGEDNDDASGGGGVGEGDFEPVVGVGAGGGSRTYPGSFNDWGFSAGKDDEAGEVDEVDDEVEEVGDAVGRSNAGGFVGKFNFGRV